MNVNRTKCLVIGQGPAGYNAAIYASRANLSPILVEGMQPGGQLTQTTVIENFPGFPQGITGPELMENMRQQAINVGTDIRSGSVVDVDFEELPYKVTLDDGKVLEADTVIIATGAAAKYLGHTSAFKDKEHGVPPVISVIQYCKALYDNGELIARLGNCVTAQEFFN